MRLLTVARIPSHVHVIAPGGLGLDGEPRARTAPARPRSQSQEGVQRQPHRGPELQRRDEGGRLDGDDHHERGAEQGDGEGGAVVGGKGHGDLRMERCGLPVGEPHRL